MLPQELNRVEKLQHGDFDPTQPEAYLKAQKR